MSTSCGVGRSWLLAWSGRLGEPAGFTLLARRPEPVLRIGLVTPLGLCVVHEDTLTPSRHRCEFKGPVLWVGLLDEEPSRRWTAGLETYGVLVEGRRCTIHGDLRGERVPVGYDLDVALDSDAARECEKAPEAIPPISALRERTTRRSSRASDRKPGGHVTVAGELALADQAWEVGAGGWLVFGCEVGDLVCTGAGSTSGRSAPTRDAGMLAMFDVPVVGDVVVRLRLRTLDGSLRTVWESIRVTEG